MMRGMGGVITKKVQVYTGIYMYTLGCRFLTISYQMICCMIVFFNTFEELHLPIKGPLEDSGVVKL